MATTPSSNVRNYNMSDATMCQQSRVKRQLFLNNKTDFVNFDPDFDGSFDSDWLTFIQNAEAVQTDETRDDVLQQETQDVLAAMRTARKKIVEVEFFAKKAFPGKPLKLDEFGFGNVTALANTQATMVTFLTSLHNLVNVKYNAEFLSVNYLQPKIDEILSIRDLLANENTEQDTFAQTSSQDTLARIVTLNKAFEFWQKVNAASKAIYYDDPIKLNQFLFPRNTESAETVSIQGTVRNATGERLANAQVQIESIGVSVTTDSNGDYIIGGLSVGNYTLRFSLAGYETFFISNVLTATSGSVIVDATLQLI